MTHNFKEKILTLWKKFKKIKHKEVYIAISLAFILGAIYFGSLTSTKDDSSQSTQNVNVVSKFSSSQEYAEYLENKLENVLSQIKGAGDVNVMLTLEKGFEYIYLTEEETRKTSSGVEVTTTNVVLVDGKPLLQEEIYPLIKGLVVLVNGQADINTKMNLISIIQTVIDIDNSKINILSAS